MRVTQDESLMFQLSGERTVHEVRFETIPKLISEVEHKSREDLKSEIDDAAVESRSRCVHDVKPGTG